MPRKKADRPTVREMLVRHGFRFTTDQPDYVDGENEVFRLRYFPRSGVIELGVKKDFDRWANSTDFSFRVPKTEKSWAEVFAQVTADAEAGRYGLREQEVRRQRYVNRSRH